MRKGIQTRKWSHPEGYKYLAPWSNAVLLRFLMRKLTETLPNSEYRMKNQTNDACRSVVANIEEGWKRPDRKAYLEYLGFSQGSLEEVKGDVRRLHQDGFLKSMPGSSLADLKIDLKEFKGKLEDDKGNTLLEVLYSPLSVFSSRPSSSSSFNPSSSSSFNSSFNDSSRPEDSGRGSRPWRGSPSAAPSLRAVSSSFTKKNLSFEIFMELINKTDWLLRGLVQSLEETTAKEDVMSPFNNWLAMQAKKRQKEHEQLDKELQQLIKNDKGKLKDTKGA